MLYKVIQVTDSRRLETLKKKLHLLSSESAGPIPQKVNAIIVFGSPQLEVPSRVVEILQQYPRLQSVPIVISGKGKAFLPVTEAERFEQEIRNGAAQQGIHHGTIFLDNEATGNLENAQNVLRILGDNGIPARDLVYVNFEVICRSGQRGLTDVGITNYYTVVARLQPAEGLSYEETLLSKEGWIDAHLRKNNIANPE